MFKPILPLIVVTGLLGPSAVRADDPPPAPTAIPQPVAPPVAVTPSGQWVNTSQYGWLWLPYDQSYTYVVPDGSVAYTYAYYPTVGWRWVAAPWVFGIGPSPYWGAYGTARFAWYAHPWFQRGVGHRGGSGGHVFEGHPSRGGSGGHGHR
jgi:hypothetical protein